jgi:hypothetical protein
MYCLAASLWPRKGGDLGNRSRFGVKGPRDARPVRAIPLPPPGSPGETDAVLLPDGSIQLVRCNHLLSLSPDGAVRWAHSFDDAPAPPVALTEGRTLVVFSDSIRVFDNRGELLTQVKGAEAARRFYSFQTCYAPAVSPDGRVFLPQEGISPFLLLEGTALRKYPVVSQGDPDPPAFYADGSLALCFAGGAKPFFGRVTPSDEVVWLTSFIGNTPPTVSSTQYAAVANRVDPDAESAIISPDGEVVGRYGEPARFAELGADWVALSASSVARITSEGKVRWKHPLRLDPDLNTHWFLNQPLVDVDGFVYVADGEQVACYDPRGEAVFTLPLKRFHPTSLTPVGTGLMGCADEDQFVIFGDG